MLAEYSQSSGYVQLGDLHVGARFGSNECSSRQIISRPLVIENLSVQLNTSSSCCRSETDKFYLFGSSNPFGDGFFFFRDLEKNLHFHEVHQYKNVVKGREISEKDEELY